MVVRMAEWSQDFGALLRGLANQGGDRITKHLVALDVYDLWTWACNHPETISRVSPAATPPI